MNRRKLLGLCSCVKMRRDRIKSFKSQERTGTCRASGPLNHTSTSAGGPPSCCRSFARRLERCGPKAYSRRPMLQRILVRRALSGQHPQSARACHQLVRTNGGRLEQAAHAVCVEWQAQAPTRARSSASTCWIRGRGCIWQAHCQLTH